MVPQIKSIQIVNSVKYWRWYVCGIDSKEAVCVCGVKGVRGGHFLFLESTITPTVVKFILSGL